TLGFPDWGNPSLSAGESIAIITTYRNTPSGQDTGQSWYVYATSVSLSAGKTIQSLTLPNDGQLHLFALAVFIPVGTSTALRSSISPSVFGQNVTFTATVTAQQGGRTPSGSVTFKDGTTTLGTGTLNG